MRWWIVENLKNLKWSNPTKNRIIQSPCSEMAVEKIKMQKGNELMNPQTAVRDCCSSCCAMVWICRAKQTNSKNEWIYTRLCASSSFCIFMCTCVCVRRSEALWAFTPSAAASATNGCCACASLELKVDLCYSTTSWQNAAILHRDSRWAGLDTVTPPHAALGLHGAEWSQHGAV